MTIIRQVEISNFRGIRNFIWNPNPGVNCLIGTGDSGKTTVLDAIDYCIGTKRTLVLNDTDFHDLQFQTPIKIAITLGRLSDRLMNFDAFGLFLRGMAADGAIHPEPAAGLETVLTIQLIVEEDLEGRWELVSERAAEQGVTKSLNWTDRLSIAPTRLGAASGFHLNWRKGSVLNKLTEERADVTAVLAKAGRDAREAFGDTANETAS